MPSFLNTQTNPNAEEPHLPSIAQVFFQELGSIDGCATHFAHECQWMVLIQVSNSTCSNKKVLWPTSFQLNLYIHCIDVGSYIHLLYHSYRTFAPCLNHWLPLLQSWCRSSQSTPCLFLVGRVLLSINLMGKMYRILARNIIYIYRYMEGAPGMH